MQVTAEQTDPCTLVLDIAVDEQQVTRTFDSVYREFSRYVNVPGFRPGKAPRVLLERYVNMEKVRERVLEKLVNDTLAQAVQEQEVTPYGRAQLQPSDIEDKKPYSYKAVIPLEPQVTLGNYTGLAVEKPVFPITDAMVEDRINRLRQSRARLDRVADRGVQAGDVLIAEQQVVMEGEENPETGRRQLIQIGNNIPGYDEAVLGMMPGEERTFELTYPDDYDEEARRGKKATFTVNLSSISAQKMPELNDDFAKDVAGMETVEELRNALRTRLEAEAEQLSNQVAEQRLIQQIVANSEVHFPSTLLREQIEEDFRQLLHDLRQRNMNYEMFLEQNGVTAEAHQTELAEQASSRIRAILALREVSFQEDLQADDAAIDAGFDRLLNEGTITEDQYAEYRGDNRRRLQMANAVVEQRIHDFLFANNTITEVVQETPPAPEELEEANEEE